MTPGISTASDPKWHLRRSRQSAGVPGQVDRPDTLDYGAPWLLARTDPAMRGAPCAPGRGTVDVADQLFRADRAALVP